MLCRNRTFATLAITVAAFVGCDTPPTSQTTSTVKTSAPMTPPPIPSNAVHSKDNPHASDMQPTKPGTDHAAPSPDPAHPIVEPAQPAPEPAKPEAEKKVDLASITLTADEMAEIKKMPEADQAAAMAQKGCPVSGEHLGEMGVPIKLDVKGTNVFLCCQSCVDKAKASPDEILAKLPKK